MDNVIGLEERIANHQDIFLSLGENSTSIIKILEAINDFLSLGDSSSGAIPVESLKNKEIM